MRIREVLVENAAWHINDVENAVRRIIKLYTQEFEVLDSTGWENATDRALYSSRGLESVIAALNPVGFKLLFVGPRYANVNEEHRVFWNIMEPRVELVDPPHGLQPQISRDKLHDVSDAIMEVTRIAYGLEVLRDPVRLVFPKAMYAELRLNTGLLIQRN